MSEKGLQRLPSQQFHLPVGFDKLSEQEQKALIMKLQEQDIELRKMAGEKLIKSQMAEHDMAVVSETVENLSAEKKVYSIKQEIETGSGKVNVNIKGGDTKFIIPIMIVIALGIIGLVALFISR